MKQLTYLFSLCLAVFLLYSCSEKPVVHSQKNLTLNEVFINKLDSMLPSHINERDYIIMYRYGSIEWTPYAAILCIAKKELHQKILHVEYFMCDVDMDGETLKNRPSCTMYRLNLENPDEHAKALDMSGLTKLSFPQLHHYVIDLYVMQHGGEGHCSNIYLIKSKQSNTIYLMNKSHNSAIFKYLTSVWRKISAMEYDQSLSLEKNCDTLIDLSAKLRLGKELDTFDFAIDHEGLQMYESNLR